MSLSKCPSCSSNHFQSMPQSVPGYNFPLNFIQCSRCGAVVGVMPEYDPGILANQNKAAIAKLEQRLNTIEQYAAEIVNRLRARP